MISFFILIIGLSLTFVIMTMFISFVRWFSLIGGVLSIVIYFASPENIRTQVDNYSDNIINSITAGNYSDIIDDLKTIEIEF